MGIKTMVQLNHHLMCAVDIETTGTRPGWHEIIQIAFLPLNNKLEPHQDKQVFECLIKPRYPERIADDLPYGMAGNVKKAQLSGFDRDVALDIFDLWYTNLKLPERKRIIPLAFCYQFDIAFLQEWMGHENYAARIDSRTRDLQTVVQFLNDRADWHGQEYPFQKERLTLNEVCKLAGVPLDDIRLHDAVYDAYITAQAYKKVCQELWI